MPKSNLIPAKYLCSITGRIMIDPVTAADGNTYEREGIEEWLKTHDTSPLTNEKLKHKELTDSLYARGDILDFLGSRPELYESDEIYLPKSWIAQLVMAIKKNQYTEVQRWLDKDRRLLTLKLEGNSTALHLACEFGSPELVDALLKIFKQKNQSIQPGAVSFKPIHLNVLLDTALNNNDYAQCESLLGLGAEVEQPEASTQNTLLHRMVIKNNLQAVSWLLERKAALESRNSQGDTPLMLSVQRRNQKLTDFLLLMNANPEVKNAQQKAPLYIAVENGDIETARLLLAHGTDPIVSYEPTQTGILHVVSARGDLAMLKLLLLTKAVSLIDAQDVNGDTALHLAVQAGHENFITLLLEMGAYHKIENAQGQTPIGLARSQQKPKIAHLIMQTVRNLKKAKLKEIDKAHQVITEQAAEIALLKRALSYESTKTMELKQALESQGQTLGRAVQEEAVRSQQLEQAFGHEKKQRGELQEVGKKAIMSQFKNFKNLNQYALKKEPLLKTLQGHTNYVYCLQLLPSGELVSGSCDYTIKVWDLRSGNCLKTLQGHTNHVYCIQRLPSGELVSGGADYTIKVWDLQSGNCLKTLQGHTNHVHCLQPLSSGQLASSSYDYTIKVWDLQSGNCLKTLQGHTSYIHCLQQLPSGELVSGSYDNTIKVWDLQSGNCLKTLQGHTGSVFCLQQLSNGQLASGSYDYTIKVWDLQSGNCLKTLQGHTSNIYCLQQLPSGELVSGSHDNTIKVWDLQSGNCLKTLQGHTSHVMCLQRLPNGELVSGSYDNTIKVWDLTEYVLERDFEKQLSSCAMQ